MKEATGELNMTVVTLIAIGAIGGLFYLFVWPMIQRTIVERTCQTYGTSFHATPNNSQNAQTAGGASDAKVSAWLCCKNGVYSTKTGDCVDAN